MTGKSVMAEEAQCLKMSVYMPYSVVFIKK